MVLMAVYAYPNLTRNASVSNLQDLLQVLICILLEPDVHQVNLIRNKLYIQVDKISPCSHVKIVNAVIKDQRSSYLLAFTYLS